jgi:hypothetical protein
MLEKPIDRWLSGAGTAVSVIFGMLPKTPTLVIVGVPLIFVLFIHQVWNLWGIEKTRIRQLLAVAMLTIECVVIGYASWPAPAVKVPTATEIADEWERRTAGKNGPGTTVPPPSQPAGVTKTKPERKERSSATVIFPPRNGDVGAIPVEIGLGGPSLLLGGPAGEAFLGFADDNHFAIRRENEKLIVTTTIRDEIGDIIAQVTHNEMAVFPRVFDYNYSADAFEVKDSKGDVVLQVAIKPHSIWLQGIWRNRNGDGIALAQRTIQWLPRGKTSSVPILPQIFKYPGKLHLGERNN